MLLYTFYIYLVLLAFGVIWGLLNENRDAVTVQFLCDAVVLL